MPRLLKIRNPFARKTEKLEKVTNFSDNAKRAKVAEEMACRLSECHGAVKRCAKALSAELSATKREKTDEKKEKHLKKLNALLDEYKTATIKCDDLLSNSEFLESQPAYGWGPTKQLRFTLDDLKEKENT